MEGDCDTHDECQEDLFCGSNNCLESLGFDSEIDCCYQPTLGDENFCASGIPCEENDGDCDFHDECQDGLACGSNNCLASLGFDSEVDCCYTLCSDTCLLESWKGDYYCDDENNNCGCEWDGGDCCGTNVNMNYCSACECLDPNASGSRKKQNMNEAISKFEKKEAKMKLDKNPNVWKYLKLNHCFDPRIEQESKEMSFEETHRLKYKEKFRNLPPSLPYHSRKHSSYHTLRSHLHKRSKYSNSLMRKTSTKSAGETELRNSHKASSKYGLTVILNPNEDEYTEALKNNFVGFKTLVHTPYNFPEVDAVGMAIDKNVQATVGIRGHHSFITDAANALGLYQKKCLSRSDDMNKNKDIKLEVFAYYTKKGCLLECYANKFFKNCGCLPYYYPDFSATWNKTTNCNHAGLQCISKLVGKKKIQ